MQSEQINELASALAKAQGSIKPAGKSAENPFFKSNYADLAAVMSACREPLSKNGLAIVQTTDLGNGEPYLETTLYHSSGQWVRGTYPIKPVKADPQGMGSAITYARRYSLMAMVGIVAEDEDDDAEAASGRSQTASGQPAKAAQPDRKSAAAHWAKGAEAAIRGFQELKDLHAWETKNELSIRDLFKVDPDLHRKIKDVLADQYEKLNPLSA